MIHFSWTFSTPQSTTHEFMLLNLELSAMENKFDDMVMMGKPSQEKPQWLII